MTPPKHSLGALLLSTQPLPPTHADQWDAWVSALDDKATEAAIVLRSLLRGLKAYEALENRGPNQVIDPGWLSQVISQSLGEALTQIRGLYVASGSYQRLSSHTSSGDQDATPQGSIIALEQSLTDFLRIVSGYDASADEAGASIQSLLQSINRDIARNPFFGPSGVLEFRLGLDRLWDAKMALALQRVESKPGYTALGLAFLCLSRIRSDLDLMQTMSQCGQRAVVDALAAATRADLRGLARFLHTQGSRLLADALSRRILKTPAAQIGQHFSELENMADSASALRHILEANATRFQTEIRTKLDAELVSDRPDDAFAVDAIHQSINAVVNDLCTAIGAHAGDETSTQRLARLRRDAWMFLHVLRAFVDKADAVAPDILSWTRGQHSQLVNDFRAHFRTIGRQVLSETDYGALDAFDVALGRALQPDAEGQALARLKRACEALIAHLEDVFRTLESGPLNGVRFDRQSAATALRTYLSERNTPVPSAPNVFEFNFSHAQQ